MGPDAPVAAVADLPLGVLVVDAVDAVAEVPQEVAGSQSSPNAGRSPTSSSTPRIGFRRSAKSWFPPVPTDCVLAAAGILSRERRGTWSWYSLRPQPLELLGELLRAGGPLADRPARLADTDRAQRC